MKDRIPVNPGRVLISPENGAPYYATMTRADNATQEGTPLNKNSLLKDATAALFGLGADAVPDDVFSYLGNYSKHWWEVYSDQSVWYVKVGAYEKVEFYRASDKTTQVTYQYSDNATVSGDGTVTLVSPVKNFVANFESFNINNSSGMITLRGKYVKLSSGQIYHISPSSELTKYQSSPLIGYVNSAALVTSYLAVAGETFYVSSTDRNAYPDSGTVDSLTYQYLGIPFENAVTAPKIATGSYTGTGTYGASNPCSLTFDFEPKLIFMDVGNTAMLYAGSAWVRPIPTIFYHGVTTAYSSDDNYTQVVTWSGNTVSWYSKDTGVNALRQMNVSGRTYKYIAIG